MDQELLEETQTQESAILLGGKPMETLPVDLYIPPDALEVFLDMFQGPLDLLLYLIKKQNLDILNIPIAKITHQYMQYVELMKQLRLELAADYLVMAAMLAEIKSRLLLPRPAELGEEDVEDPRAELVRRLQEYERFKIAAEEIGEMPRMGRDTYSVPCVPLPNKPSAPPPSVAMEEILRALAEVMRRTNLEASHDIQSEPLSVRERMSAILDRVQIEDFVPFTALFSTTEGRSGVIVTFIALLELLKESLIDFVQTELFGPIYVKAVDNEQAIDSQETSDHH